MAEVLKQERATSFFLLRIDIWKRRLNICKDAKRMWGLAKMVSLKVAALPFLAPRWFVLEPKLAMGNQYGGPVNIIHCSFISGSISSATTRGGGQTLMIALEWTVRPLSLPIIYHGEGFHLGRFQCNFEIFRGRWFGTCHPIWFFSSCFSFGLWYTVRVVARIQDYQ